MILKHILAVFFLFTIVVVFAFERGRTGINECLGLNLTYASSLMVRKELLNQIPNESLPLSNSILQGYKKKFLNFANTTHESDFKIKLFWNENNSSKYY